MRLDHLLSKEPYGAPCGVCPCRPVLHRSCVAGRAPECGTLTVKPGHRIGRQYNPARVWGVESRLVGWVGLSTLLGPEGSLTLVGGFSVRTDAGPVWGVWVWFPPVC